MDICKQMPWCVWAARSGRVESVWSPPLLCYCVYRQFPWKKNQREKNFFILSAVYYVIDLKSEFAGDIFADFSRKEVKITENYCLEMILRSTVCN